MTDDTLKLLQAATRKRGAPITSVSQQATDLCGVIDHWNRLHWEDRNRLTEETRRLKERLARLEKDEA